MVEIKRHWLGESFLVASANFTREISDCFVLNRSEKKSSKKSPFCWVFVQPRSFLPSKLFGQCPRRIIHFPLSQVDRSWLTFRRRTQAYFLQTWPVYWSTNSLHLPRSSDSVRNDLIICGVFLCSLELQPFVWFRARSDFGVSRTNWRNFNRAQLSAFARSIEDRR